MKALFGKKERAMKRYICGECVKGAAHERNNKPLQDSKKIIEISDRIVILAVADGHGSDRCIRSDRGSVIAVNSFYAVMKNYLLSYGQDANGMANLVTFLNREGDTRFAQDLCEEWQTRIKQSFYKNKIEEMVATDGMIDWKAVYTLYGTTLLGMLITDSFVFSFQIGDGEINLITETDICSMVEAEKFLGTETHSLSKPDAWRKAVTSLRRKNMGDNTPYLYMLSTDGFLNSHASDEEFQKTCREYFNMIGQYGFEEVKNNLARWLKETSEYGCGDDITVVMAYFA